MISTVHISVKNKRHITLITYRYQFNIMFIIICTYIIIILSKAEYLYQRRTAGLGYTIHP